MMEAQFEWRGGGTAVRLLDTLFLKRQHWTLGRVANAVQDGELLARHSQMEDKAELS